MATLTEGQQKAADYLNLIKSRSASDYNTPVTEDMVMSDPEIQAALQSSEGSYDQNYINNLIAQRRATLSGSGSQALAQQTYDKTLQQANDNVTWWDQNPNGHDGFLDKAMPWVAAILAVVATAGATSGVLGEAVAAGDTVAAAGGAAVASGAVDAAVTSAVTTAAATIPEAAAAIQGAMQTVVITGSAGGAALTGAQLAGALGVTAAAGAAATAGGSSAVADQPMQQVEIKGQKPVPDTSAAPAAAAAATGVSIPDSSLPPVVVPPLNPMDPVNPVKDGAENIPVDKPAGTGLPTNTPPIPKIPATGGTTGTNASGTGGLGSLLTPAAVTAALAAFNAGNKDAVANPALSDSISKLGAQGDTQMSQWNNWMFPTLSDALANNKAATDSFVTASGTNAGKMEGMADQQSQYARDYLQRNKDVYIPLADKIIADANQFNKAGYGEQQSGLAIGDMQAAYAAQRAAEQQRQAQYGIDPTSGRAMATSAASGVTNAANTASAATRARIAAEELWGKKQVDALGTSNVLNANANTYAGLNSGAGSLYTGANGIRRDATAATSAYFTNADELAKTSNSTYSTANNAYNSAGTLGLGLSKLENDRYIAEQQGRGQVLGAGLQAVGGSGGIGNALGSAAGSAWDAIKNTYNTVTGGSSSPTNPDGSTDWNTVRDLSSTP